MYDVYVLESALHAAETHFAQAARRGMEALGLFCGQAYAYQGTPYAVLEEYLTAPNEATAVSVRFSREAFSALASSLSGGRRVLSWAHSHPDYGCFLSFTDLKTSEAYFNEPFHSALVVDPVRSQRKFFKLDGNGGYREVSYAVIRKRAPHG